MRTVPASKQVPSILNIEAALDTRTREEMKYVYAPDTQNTYQKITLWFIRWTIFMGYYANLTNFEFVINQVIPRYTSYLAATQSYKTLKLTLNGIRLYYLGQEQPNPLANSHAHAQHMRALRRKMGDVPKPKLPITMRELTWLALACNMNAPEEVAFTAAAMIAFFAFLRKSNVTTGHQTATDIASAIAMQDVIIDEQNYMLFITLRCTKTIQFGERTLRIPIYGRRGSPTDPVAWWKLHLCLQA